MAAKCGTVELFFAKHWRKFALLTCALMLVSCAYSRLTPDGGIETVGQDIIPGVTVGEDVIGAVVDAVEQAPVGDLIEAVRTSDWLSVGYFLLALGGIGVGGYIARKKIRNRKKVA